MGRPAALLARWQAHRLHLGPRGRGQYLGDERRRQRQAAGDEGGLPPAEPAELVADGRFIAAKKHFTTERSAGTGEIWLYHVSGGGGVQVVERANERLQKELGEPVFAPDGSAIYYTRNTTPGNTFEYAQDSQTGIFAIERHDLASGEVTTAVGGYGGAVRPAPSPDGKAIASCAATRTRPSSG